MIDSRIVGLSLLLAGLAAPAFAQDEPALAALAAESQPTPAQAIAEAHRLTAAGDLLGAAATLERALLADPNANDARLIYAATLCRLGDNAGARIEIGKLQGQDTGNAAWTEVAEACGGQFARPIPNTAAARRSLTGELYGGLAVDSDAGRSTDLLDPGGFDPASGRGKAGTSLIYGGRLSYRTPGYTARLGAYAEGSLAGKRDISGPDQRYWVGELRAGAGHDGRGLGYAIGGVYRHVHVLGQRLDREWGGQVELMVGDPSRARLHLRGEAVNQQYGALYPTFRADGMRYDLSGAVEGRLGQRNFYVAGLGYEAKDTDDRVFRYLGYRGWRLFGAVQLTTGGARDPYVNFSGTLRRLDFVDSPAFPDRKDWRGFVRGAFGLPIVGDNVFIEWAGSYSYRRPKFSGTGLGGSIDTATYRSVGFENRLIWKF